MGNCIIVDDQSVLVPEGSYQLQFIEHETVHIFAPKVVLRFKIVSLQEYMGALVCRYYNVKYHVGPQKIGGDFKVGPRSDYVREYVKVFGDNTDLNNIDVNNYKGKVVIGEVGTVSKCSKKQDIPKMLQYSNVKAITGSASEPELSFSTDNTFNSSDQDDHDDWN